MSNYCRNICTGNSHRLSPESLYYKACSYIQHLVPKLLNLLFRIWIALKTADLLAFWAGLLVLKALEIFFDTFGINQANICGLSVNMMMYACHPSCYSGSDDVCMSSFRLLRKWLCVMSSFRLLRKWWCMHVILQVTQEVMMYACHPSGYSGSDDVCMSSFRLLRKWWCVHVILQVTQEVVMCDVILQVTQEVMMYACHPSGYSGSDDVCMSSFRLLRKWWCMHVILQVTQEVMMCACHPSGYSGSGYVWCHPSGYSGSDDVCMSSFRLLRKWWCMHVILQVTQEVMMYACHPSGYSGSDDVCMSSFRLLRKWWCVHVILHVTQEVMMCACHPSGYSGSDDVCMSSFRLLRKWWCVHVILQVTQEVVMCDVILQVTQEVVMYDVILHVTQEMMMYDAILHVTYNNVCLAHGEVLNDTPASEGCD